MSARGATYSVLVAGLGLVLLGQVSPAALSTELVREWDLSEGALSLFGSAWFLSYALFQIPAGLASDAWGVRWAATLGLGVIGVTSLLFALAPSPEIAVLGRAGMGAGSAFVFMPLLRSIAISFSRDRYATLVGVANSLAAVGTLVGTAPLAIAAAHWGWRLPSVLMAAYGLTLAGLAQIFVRENPRMSFVEHRALTNRATPRRARNRSRTLLKEGVLEVRDDPLYGRAMLILLLGLGPFLGFQTLWAAPLMSEIYRFSPTEVGIGLLLIAAGTIISFPLAGFVSDRVIRSRRPIFILGTSVLICLWTVVVARMGELPTGAAHAIMLAFGLSAGLVLLAQAVVLDLAPSRLIGTILSLVNTGLLLGTAGFQVVTGVILEVTQGAESFRMAFVVSLVGAVISVVVAVGTSETFGSRERAPDS